MADHLSQQDAAQPLSVVLGRPSRLRKSVRIKVLVEHINRRLADPDLGFETRVELSLLAEQLLMATGCYRGFKYLESEWDRSNPEAPCLRVGYDDFRREYFVVKELS